MPLMEAAFRGEYFGQETINRWNFVSSGTPAAVTLSFALANAMGMVRNSVVPYYPAPGYLLSMLAMQANTFICRELVVKDVYSNTDFYTTPYINGEVGLAAAEGLSPITAFGWRTNRVRSDIARGTKRLAGVPVDANATGGVVDAAYVTLMGTLGTVWGNTLTYDDEGNTITFTPCIVSKEKYTTPSGKFAYRYYPSYATQSAHLAQGIAWEAYPTLRGQGSRQYGKGA